MAHLGDARHQLHRIQWKRSNNSIFTANNEVTNETAADEWVFYGGVIAVYFFIGAYYAVLGYRFFRLSMFATGFFFVYHIVYPYLTSEEDSPPNIRDQVMSVLAGFLFGLVTMLVQIVGLFISGLNSGVLKGASILLVYSNAHVTNEPTAQWISLLVCIVTGLTSACLNVYCKKGLTIISTSIYGGALMAISVDYFVANWNLVHWIYNRVLFKPSVGPPPSFAEWWILSLWPITAFAGMFIQFFYTGKGIHHDEACTDCLIQGWNFFFGAWCPVSLERGSPLKPKGKADSEEIPKPCSEEDSARVFHISVKEEEEEEFVALGSAWRIQHAPKQLHAPLCPLYGEKLERK